MSRYKIISIQKANPPEGTTSKRWYQYVIANNINTITSTRAGSEKEVRKVAADAVKRLNDTYLTNCKTKHFNMPVNETSFSTYF